MTIVTKMTRPIGACFAGLLGVGLLSAACGGGPLTPTPSGATQVTTVFSATLSPGGKIFYTPIITEATDVTMTLVSVTAVGGNTALQTRLGLAYGVPDENDPANTCNRTNQTTATPSLITQFRVTSTAVTHCVEVFDPGSLTSDVIFAVRVTTTPVLYKPPTPPATAGTETFTGLLPVGSTASRAFTTAQAGPINVTLTSAGPPANIAVGLGLGVPKADNSSCYVTTTVITTAGSAPQISMPVEPGSYCVRVFDPGTMTTAISFTTTAAHP